MGLQRRTARSALSARPRSDGVGRRIEQHRLARERTVGQEGNADLRDIFLAAGQRQVIPALLVLLLQQAVQRVRHRRRHFRAGRVRRAERRRPAHLAAGGKFGARRFAAQKLGDLREVGRLDAAARSRRPISAWTPACPWIRRAAWRPHRASAAWAWAFRPASRPLFPAASRAAWAAAAASASARPFPAAWDAAAASPARRLPFPAPVWLRGASWLWPRRRRGVGRPGGVRGRRGGWSASPGRAGFSGGGGVGTSRLASGVGGVGLCSATSATRRRAAWSPPWRSSRPS